jgi:hypothetical protein
VTIFLDFDPDSKALGSSDIAPFQGCQIDPDADSEWHPGRTVSDFLQIIAPGGAWGERQALQFTDYPAENYEGTQRVEAVYYGTSARNDNPGAPTLHWTDDPNDPDGFATIYYAARYQFGHGDVGFGYSDFMNNQQWKVYGYDDPALAGTSETINYQSTPVATWFGRGSTFCQDMVGGVYMMQTPGTTITPGYNSNSYNQWTRVYGQEFAANFVFFDIVWEFTLSLGEYQSLDAVPVGEPAGRVRQWIRKQGDTRPLDETAHLIFDSYADDPGGESWATGTPNAKGPRRHGAIENWNWKGSDGFTAAGGTPGGGVTDGRMPPQGAGSTGMYHGGWWRGDTAPMRMLLGPFRICDSLEEAFACLDGDGGTPPEPVPPDRVAVTMSGATYTLDDGSDVVLLDDAPGGVGHRLWATATVSEEEIRAISDQQVTVDGERDASWTDTFPIYVTEIVSADPLPEPPEPQPEPPPDVNPEAAAKHLWQTVANLRSIGWSDEAIQKTNVWAALVDLGEVDQPPPPDPAQLLALQLR